MSWIALAVGIALGLLVGFLLASMRAGRSNQELRLRLAQLEGENRAHDEKLEWSEKAQQQLRESFQALANEALASNSGQFLDRVREQLASLLTQVRGDWGTHKQELRNLVEPLEKTLEAMDKQVRSMEEKREGAYQSLEKHIDSLGQAQSKLRDTTLTLAQALKSPTERGRWGEYQLRRVMELAGMTDHIDFSEQESTGEGRPDVIVHLPNQGILPVDSKAPHMDAFFAATESRDEDERRGHLRALASRMRQHIQELGKKEYWSQFERAPEFVIMYIPSEACVSAAFQSDPAIFEYATRKRVLITSPVTMLALLRSVAYGWQQQKITQNVREIAKQGQELYERTVKFLQLFQKTGRGLEQAIDAYDSAVGSLEHRLLPAARKFRDLNESSEDLPALNTLDRKTRSISGPEMTDQAD